MSYYPFRILFLLFLSPISFTLAGYKSLSVAAFFAPAENTKIHQVIRTKPLTDLLQEENKKHSAETFWFDQKPSKIYHVTLDIFTPPSEQSQFEDSDRQKLGQIVQQDFFTKAKNFKAQKGYVAEGYQLMLFVHYTDGTHEHFSHKNIASLLSKGKDVTYANVVLRVGTKGTLRDDWLDFQKTTLSTYKNIFVRKTDHDLNTHVTIGNFLKYAKRYKSSDLKGKTKPVSVPWVGEDLDLMVAAFNTIGWDKEKLKSLPVSSIAVVCFKDGSWVPNPNFMFKDVLEGLDAAQIEAKEEAERRARVARRAKKAEEAAKAKAAAEAKAKTAQAARALARAARTPEEQAAYEKRVKARAEAVKAKAAKEAAAHAAYRAPVAGRAPEAAKRK